MVLNRELLEKQFTGKEIKQRKGNFGASIDYVEVQLIIQRLNDAFDGYWSFDIIEHATQGDEVVVLGKLSCNGISKQQFGNSKITVSKKGEVVSIGDDLKAAASDSLKKCASMFGVALHLYGDSIPDQPVENSTELPPPLPEKEKPEADDKVIVYRKAFFAQPIINKMSDEDRHDWLFKHIKVHSTKELTLPDWVRAIELARLQSEKMEFHDANGDKLDPPQRPMFDDGKKELPKLKIPNGNGNNLQITKSQITYITHLLEQKGYFINEEITAWKQGQANATINFLK